MENNIASILFARGIMPDDFISYSTYGAVAEIVKELKQLEAERSELVKENERLKEALSEIRHALYDRDTDDAILDCISKHLDEAGFPYEIDD